MDAQYTSETVNELKRSDYVLEREDVTVHLAKDFGFCWGVEVSEGFIPRSFRLGLHHELFFILTRLLAAAFHRHGVRGPYALP